MMFFSLRWCVIFFAFVLPRLLWGADAVTVPAGEALLADDALAAFSVRAQTGMQEAMKSEVVEVAEGAPVRRGWRVETARDLSPAWAVELGAPLVRGVKQGDVALVHFFARTIASADETGGGQLRVVVQKAGPGYDKSLEKRVTVGREWREYFLPLAFHADFAEGGAEVCLGFGYKRQTLEIGGLELINYGTTRTVAELPRTRSTYVGREADAAWRREALERIETIRKSGFAIRVVDAAGKPVANASVRVEQRRSAFHFGSALQFERLVKDTPDNLRYRQAVLELFNAASPENDLKWPVWLGEWGGSFPHEQSLKALRWLRAQGLHTRGHVLVWPGWKNLPLKLRALHDKEPGAVRAAVLAHIREITKATKGLLDEWDVLNEPYDNHDLMDQFGDDVMVEWFKAARAALPEVPLYLNDYANHDEVLDAVHVAHFEKTARFLKEKAPLGGLGVQAHISGEPNPPVRVLATFDRYAKLGLPLRITEFDISTEDEELQADYMRDFLILCFSHPSVVGVQLWGFWEKAHWRPTAALIRADWSEKPSAKNYRSLVLDHWRTRLAGTTGAGGEYAARGFHGEYVVVVEHGGKKAEKTFSLRAGERLETVTVRVP